MLIAPALLLWSLRYLMAPHSKMRLKPPGALSPLFSVSSVAAVPDFHFVYDHFDFLMDWEGCKLEELSFLAM